MVVIAAVFAHIQINKMSDGRLCHWEDKSNNLCDHSKITQIDRYTKFLYRMVRSSIDQVDSLGVGTPEGKDVHIPKRQVRLPKVEALPGVYLPVEDEDMDHMSWIAKLVGVLTDKFLQNPYYFPLTDTEIFYDSVEEGIETLKLAAGEGSLVELTHWDEHTSDKALTRWVFGGLASHLVQALPAPTLIAPDPDVDGAAFMVDLDWMKTLEVREGFERFGAIAYFNNSLDVVRIHWSHDGKNYYPPQPDANRREIDRWEHVKFAFRSSILTGVTLKDHLASVHLKLANIVTTVVREALPIYHPMRRFITPFTYRTIEVNRGAAAYLCAEMGVLHRATALTAKGVVDGFQAALKTPYRPLLSSLEGPIFDALGDQYPFRQDAIDFQHIVRKFVTAYVDVYYPTNADLVADENFRQFWKELLLHTSRDDNIPNISSKKDLCELLTQYITLVTAYHKMVGSVSEYVTNPVAATGKIRPDKNVADVQASLQTLIIALFTSYPQPKLLDNFQHLLLEDEYYSQTKNIFTQFTKDLKQLQEKIEQRNLIRPYPYNAFNPKYLLSAVSI